MTSDLAAVENDLRRIPEVRAARIVADEEGMPLEVHVLASPGKAAKQLVRDVVSVAIASQGLEIDHRIVSVVQLDDPTLASAISDVAEIDLRERDRFRVSLGRVRVDRHELRSTASVALDYPDGLAEGAADGSASQAAIRRAVASATLDALRHVNPAATAASVDSVSIIRAGEHDVALAVLTLVVPPYEEVLSGTAPVRATGVDEAIARAVLDACNRRLVGIR